MQILESLLIKFAKRKNARWWTGKRPDVREGQLAKAIARQVGLPTSAEDPFVHGSMVHLNRSEAAHVLAVAGTTSLAYGRDWPSKEQTKEARKALNDLAEDANFLTNGRWEIFASYSWSPFTCATFDCGIIGFDRENAFIFWVEEED